MNTDLPSAQPAGRRFSMIWIVPVIALLVGGYLVYRELRTKGPVIHIQLPYADGLAAGHTKLVFKGLIIGEVTDISLLPDESGVEVTAQLDRGAGSLARSTTKFWIHRPEISLKGLKGLDALLNGPSIWVHAGETNGTPQREFKGFISEPEGLGESFSVFKLTAPYRRSITEGTPVAFRGVEVGRVESIALRPDATAVDITILIQVPYDRLVHANTVFWNASGIDMDFSLFHGVTVRDGGVGSLLSGSISFATPDKPAPAATRDQVFELQDRMKKEWQKWSTAIPLDDPEPAPAPPETR